MLNVNKSSVHYTTNTNGVNSTAMTSLHYSLHCITNILFTCHTGSAERFNCKGRILGAYYADAKSGCKAFHVCVRVAGGGIRDFRFFCPPGTLFHQEAQTCTDWGDDDPLACPADIYDGQFDLYRIGSGELALQLTKHSQMSLKDWICQRFCNSNMTII